MVTALLPGSLVAWKPPIPDLPVSEPQWAPRSECICTGEGGREEGRRPEPTLAPVPCCLHPSCAASIPMSCSLPSLPWLLGIRMVFTVAPPPLKWGAGQGRDLAPHYSPHPQATMFPLSWCVFPPPLCLSSRPPRSSPCPPCSLLHWPPTNLSWPLSPSPSSHLLLTGMSLGQRQSPSPLPLPLCALVSLSLSVL